MKLPINERIVLAQKLLPDLDPLSVEEAVLEMRLTWDGAEAVQKLFHKDLASKKVKAKLKRHGGALRRVLHTRQELLREAGSAYGVIAALSKSDEVIRKDLASVESMLKDRAEKPSRFDPMARVAISTARMLLLQAGRRPLVAHKSDWSKLAAILVGEPNKDLFNTIRAYRTETGRERTPPLGD